MPTLIFPDKENIRPVTDNIHQISAEDINAIKIAVNEIFSGENAIKPADEDITVSDTDLIHVNDSDNDDDFRSISIGQLKAFLKTYFDGLYVAI